MPDRPGPGRPAFVPTNKQRRLVQVLHAHGIGFRTIARNLDTEDREPPRGISVQTLRKHFKTELRDAHEQIKSAMVAALVRAGTGGNVNAIKYWLLCWGGPEWRMQAKDGDSAFDNPSSAETVIVVRGGIPSIHSNVPPEMLAPRFGEYDPIDDNPFDGDRINGKGNGHGLHDTN